MSDISFCSWGDEWKVAAESLVWNLHLLKNFGPSTANLLTLYHPDDVSSPKMQAQLSHIFF